MIVVGFTGTRSGMTDTQAASVRQILHVLGDASPDKKLECRHGDCVGADAQFHASALSIGARVVVHPPLDPSDQAHCVDYFARRPPLPNMKRNREIVLASEFVIAAPYADKPVGKHPGGTWRTVDIARKERRSLVVCFRDGTVDVSGAPSWFALNLGLS